jgi:hypothetical protein
MEGVRLAWRMMKKLSPPLNLEFLRGLHRCLTSGKDRRDAGEIRDRGISIGHFMPLAQTPAEVSGKWNGQKNII